MTAAEQVLSASSLKSFFRCPRQYEFSHIQRIKAPPSIKLQLGIAVHAGAEHNFRQKLETRTDEPIADTLDAFSSTYDYGVQEIEKPDEDPGKAKDQGVQLTKLYHIGGWDQPAVAPDIQPLWVERNTTFRVRSSHDDGCDGNGTCKCGVPFSATIDLVDEARQIRDMKSTAKTPSQGQHLMQLAGGAIGFEAETGEQANDLIIDYLIRTKIPKYHQERWGGKVDRQMKKVFAQQVEVAHRMINEGTFPATAAEAGPGGPCSWCGYGPKGADLCEVWRRPK